MTYAKRVDLNHQEIVKTLRWLGATVFDASRMGQGFPDLVVGYNHQTVLVEIKSGEQKKFTQAQLKFMADWKGSAVTRINDVDGAIRLIKVLDMQ
jgi:Holliday junction resolvase